MADLVILPHAYINGWEVLWNWDPENRSRLTATVRVPFDPGWRTFAATATNPERALQDLREAVELAEHGVVAQSLAGSKH